MIDDDIIFQKENIQGTFIYELFDDEQFKAYKRKTSDNFVATMKAELDVDKIIESISQKDTLNVY